MVRLRRIGVIRTSTAVAVVWAIMTFIFAALFALFVGLGASWRFGNLSGTIPAATAIWILVGGFFFAIFYAVIGWIATAVFCLIYNLAARMTGGIELTFVTVAPPPPPVATPQWTAPQPAAPAPASAPAPAPAPVAPPPPQVEAPAPQAVDAPPPPQAT